MSQYNSATKRGDLAAITTGTGVIIPCVVDPKTAANTGCTLPSGTFFFPFGSEISPVPAEVGLIGLGAIWSLALAATMTIEATNCAAYQSGMGGSLGAATDLLDYDSTNGWVQIDPTLAGPVFAAATGAGNTMTKYTAVAGGAAGGAAIWSIPQMGLKRFRLKVVVTTGGLLRVTVHGKAGA